MLTAPTSPASVTPPAVTMTGHASWYGEAHHGRLGQQRAFDMNALTAAHLAAVWYAPAGGESRE
jgi:rare lipoprotein A (peptidoglycan hydrolase)